MTRTCFRARSASLLILTPLALFVLASLGGSEPALAAEPEVTLSPQPASRAVAVSPISISAPATRIATVGAFVTISATAGGGDPGSIITITATGGPPDLAFSTNTPTDVNPSASLSGLLSAASGGSWSIQWTASNQFGAFDSTTTLLTVSAPNQPPVLNAIADMTVTEGSTATQTIGATDPDGNPLAFSRISGPSFVSIVTDDAGSGSASGRVIASPGSFDSGAWQVNAQVTDGQATDADAFFVTVQDLPANRSPVFDPIPSITMDERATLDQAIRATDADGDPLTFVKSSGPAFVTVTTTSPGTGVGMGNIHLAPGSTDSGQYFADIYVTDGIYFVFQFVTITVNDVPVPPIPGQPVWQVLTSFIDSRTGSGIEGAAASLIGDKIYVSHGYRFFDSAYLSVYDILANTWTHGGASAPTALFSRSELAGGTALGRHYAIGGRTQPNAQVEEFDPVAGSWSTKAPLPQARGGLGAASWNNKIYAVGGRAGGSYGSGPIYNRLDVYDPSTNQWTTRAPMPQAVSDNYATVAFQGRVYVFGGTDGLGHLATTQIYNITTNTWSLGTPMPTPRGAAMAGVIGGKIAVFGGYNGANLTVTEMYDPATNTWTAGNEMPQAVSEMAAGVTFDHRGIFSIGSGIFGVSSGIVMVLRPLISIEAPPEVAVDEGQPVSFLVRGTHIDGLDVSLRAVGVPLGASFTDHGDNTGTFSWMTTFDQAGSYPVTFLGDAGDGSAGTSLTTIVVRNVNRGPTADAGGPYTSTVNVPVVFDGTGSSDPDGSQLTYTWVFGDGGSGMGVTPSHAYAASGTYGVALTVSDGSLSDLATTTASIVDLFQARAFTAGGGRTIKLSAGKPTWCAQVEPIGGSFNVNLVDPASIVMKSSGTGAVDEITAASGKTSVGADRDGNGLEEITACFGKDDLRLLFDDIHGTVTVTVSIEGRLFTGGRFFCAIDVAVHGSGGGASASVSPNPLNPEAILTFVSPVAGPVRIQVYGSDGRLVRELFHESFVPAGYHDVRFDGRDSGGERLASGVYFYRVETAAGEVGGRFAIVK